ncbi:putative histidinol-phosphatase [uncultured Desulfatiglans sp.]|uniref:Histidinol-phosphatase n=1 Tax=Uncultured Desulfatiglans sp. TaxID=1748965 RepID=A0A653AGA9_UNCDX|nr:putative histidinol-phosphatase [uncultured Desulfatiglans sp.]
MSTCWAPLDLPDYHIHTPLCHHAVGAVAEYKAAAATKGIPEICFTDHAPTDTDYDPAHRMTLQEFPRYCGMIENIRTPGPPEVLFGVEADYYKGCRTFLENWLPRHAFDLVIGSVHFIASWGFDNPDERHVWDAVDVTETWKRYFALICKLADTRLFDVVGHLDLPKKFDYRPPGAALREMAAPALDRIAEAGMGIELNTAGLRKPVGEIYPSLELLAWARERGIPICFGSDAHQPEDVGEGFPEALKLAYAAGYTEYFRIRQRRKTLLPLPPIPAPLS